MLPDADTDGPLNFAGTPGEVINFDILVNHDAKVELDDPAPVSVISDTSLILHPVSVDLRQTNDGPVTTKASFLIWNENETKFSARRPGGR